MIYGLSALFFTLAEIGLLFLPENGDIPSFASKPAI